MEVQEDEGDFLTVEAGVAVEVPVMMELGAWDTLKSVAWEEVSGVEASNLSSVVAAGAAAGDVGVVPRPGLVPGGSLLEVSTVYTASLLQPNQEGCNLRYSTFCASVEEM